MKKLTLLNGEIMPWCLYYEEWCNKFGWTLSIFRIHLVEERGEEKHSNHFISWKNWKQSDTVSEEKGPSDCMLRTFS